MAEEDQDGGSAEHGQHSASMRGRILWDGDKSTATLVQAQPVPWQRRAQPHSLSSPETSQHEPLYTSSLMPASMLHALSIDCAFRDASLTLASSAMELGLTLHAGIMISM